ncbi:hypothetical protein GCM10010393_07530 [Streptomyces gobitricini]|uniref:Major facilitator superfamily (MFS) profile domain-containing protein n=1 Tax=Streptomyces gobitricini TaxID=68211 RepID=A0ABN3LAW2_9ACTN
MTTAGVLTAMPLGGLGAGHLVEQAGLATALLVIGGLYFVATMAPAVFPSWGGMDGPAAAVSSSGPSSPVPGRAVTTPRP